MPFNNIKHHFWLVEVTIFPQKPKQMTPPRGFADPHQGPTWPVYRAGASNSGIDVGKMIGMKKYGKTMEN